MKRTEYRKSEFKFNFVEYLPEVKTSKMPLIIQLHGAGERGNGEDELHLVDKLGFSKHLEKNEYNCIFVMPQCENDSFWAAKVESIITFIEQMIEYYDADRDRVYLTGISMGGFGTWYTAMARPDMFAAIAPVCGGGMDWTAAVLNMPIWTFHGADDNVVNPVYTELMVNKLTELGLDVKYTKLEGVQHNAWDYTFNEELANWLLSKKRCK